MQPLRDRVVIELDEQSKEVKKGGLFYQAPKWAKPQNMAKVIKKGLEVSAVAEGDYILIDPYAYIDTEEKNIKIIREKDILCIADNTAAPVTE